jgi:hypothetical protein
MVDRILADGRLDVKRQTTAAGRRACVRLTLQRHEPESLDRIGGAAADAVAHQCLAWRTIAHLQ